MQLQHDPPDRDHLQDRRDFAGPMRFHLHPAIEQMRTTGPTKMTASRAMINTGNHAGNGRNPDRSLQLLMLNVMTPLRSRPLSAIGSRIMPNELR